MSPSEKSKEMLLLTLLRVWKIKLYTSSTFLLNKSTALFNLESYVLASANQYILMILSSILQLWKWELDYILVPSSKTAYSDFWTVELGIRKTTNIQPGNGAILTVNS